MGDAGTSTICMPTDTAAQLAMLFALKGSSEYERRRDSHQANLLETIRIDFSKHQLKLKCKADILNLREQVTDKNS